MFLFFLIIKFAYYNTKNINIIYIYFKLNYVYCSHIYDKRIPKFLIFFINYY